MTSRKPRSRVSIADMLPIWTTTETSTVNLVVASIFLDHDITDVPSYFQKLRIPIAICFILSAIFCESSYGIWGFFLGGLAGLAAPAVLLWLGVLLLGALIFLVIYIITWLVVLWVLWWLVSGIFRF